MKQAAFFLAGHLSFSLLVLLTLNPLATAYSFAIFPIVCIYPLMKRYTNYPQVILGSTFNFGLPIAFTALSNSINLDVVIPAYLGGILWTLIYDTAYAH
jgi:4-hydroxybenzoate polyprenyltransferase